MRKTGLTKVFTTGLVWVLATACGDGAWNNPYSSLERGENILYSSFSERPKHLDPARSYSSNEYAFIGQIYEPPLQYHYLKRPYELTELTAYRMPLVTYYDKDGGQLSENAPTDKVAESEYLVRIKPGILYQPHPAFAKDGEGNFLYHELKAEDIDDKYELADFEANGTRNLEAGDYVYQIKRLAHPAIHSPIFGTMSEYIVGLSEFGEQLKNDYAELKKQGKTFLDLTSYQIKGVEVVDRYSYRIRVKGKYPQLLYWLAMPFFAPMAPEVDRFYAQNGMAEKNITLDWYPVGTGAFMLTVNNPNRKMLLERNPNYRGDTYPTRGEPGDREAGLLEDAGNRMPFIDKAIYLPEKETIPYWNKFLQGYYDTSGISSESFDQAIQFSAQGDVGLSESMTEKNIRLSTVVASSVYYMGFNMQDPVVGGLSKANQKLRQAISIAIDYEEFISIFANGRGIPAQGPIPPGIYGYRDGKNGINPFVYDWVDGKPKRKSIDYAKKLLAEAGFTNGIDQKTNTPLILNLDITASGPDDKARLNWYVKQLKKIDIQLNIRNTMYNRFQEKMLKGTAQIFVWGWNADYPDPENFLFLLYGPNAKVNKNGENAANYSNSHFDKLFEQMKNMPNSPKRMEIIDKMVSIVQEDAPWIWGMNPKQFGLYHEWFKNAKPNLMSHNTLQYKRIDTRLRDEKREQWNKPVTLPIYILLTLFFISAVPAFLVYRHRLHKPAVKPS
ncbi:MAG: ABC transporter substrate-binding protein [Gammaproteobacteria bacterium]|nr:ABC transporter substrate-binding protein [Gammaproteobacteria bacterium]